MVPAAQETKADFSEWMANLNLYFGARSFAAVVERVSALDPIGPLAASVELPIAGLMSDAPAEEVAAKAAAMVQAMADCGCHLNNAYMQHSLLALVVIPELRISDLGLVDVRKFELVPVLRKEGQDADA